MIRDIYTREYPFRTKKTIRRWSDGKLLFKMRVSPTVAPDPLDIRTQHRELP